MTARSLPLPIALTPAPLLGRAWALLKAMHQARRTRLLLAEMDERMLADIGIARGDALLEASRPMWDIAPRRR
ncbi:MAG: DUF1127 domain-containing protein [Acetobacteraceae bacterium]|nr:DUF1127 domain-containing protein [Acetobacteraceae bacterium]